MPAVDRDRIAALAVVVRQDGRGLFQHHGGGKFLPFVVLPGFWVKRIIIARANRIVPLPGAQFSMLRMPRGQYLRNTVSTFGFLIHGKLVCPDGFILMDSGLDVPAREVSAIGPRECA